jgi:hypothetical protein
MIENFNPYLYYWIETVTRIEEKNGSPTTEDNLWRFVLINYIIFYPYQGLIKIFEAFGKKIKPNSFRYEKLAEAVKDKKLAADVRNCLANQPKTNL